MPVSKEAGIFCKESEMKYNAFEIFHASSSSAGLYARKKWLGESDNPDWKRDFDHTVLSLMEKQSADGSWFQSPLETIRRLFGLHLTYRERTPDIHKGLEWLINQTLTKDLSGLYSEQWASDDFQGLPFVAARQPLTLMCATLFLASVFQMEKEDRVETHYQLLIQWLAAQEREEDIWPDRSNILRALIVHPVYAKDPATFNLVNDLAKQQKDSGIWPSPIPFFLTLNALAHLDSEPAHLQWEKAFPLLVNVQKKDGSWGGEDHEWNTFLVVHALKNKKLL